MPVTIFPSEKALTGVNLERKSPVANARELLKSSCAKSLSNRAGEIFQSSFTDSGKDASAVDVQIPSKTIEEDQTPHIEAGRFAAIILSETSVLPAANGHGFVDSAMRAYNSHHALVLRPDDVWLAILAQFNLYVNANSELLRHLFVGHEGQKELTVVAVGTRYTIDFGEMSRQMGNLLQENILDAELRDWIVPDFTTTEDNDRVVASVVMMATLKAYFKYRFMLMCGIPQVTLLGEKADWEKLLSKIDKLKMYGHETTEWSNLLRPVLKRFVTSFESPHSETTKDFWQRIAHERRGGSGPDYVHGWIVAFCFFDDKGQCMRYPRQIESSQQKFERFDEDPDKSATSDLWDTSRKLLRLDGVIYHSITTNSIPPAIADVNVLLDDNGEKLATVMVAGLVGVKVSSSGIKAIAAAGMGHDGQCDTVQPIAGWWLFEDKEKVATAG